MILLSNNHVTRDLICRKISDSLWVMIWSCNSKLFENIYIFCHQLLFDLEKSISGTSNCQFQLKHEKLLPRISFRKVVLKIWNSLQNIIRIFLKLCFEIKLFQVYSLQWVPVFGIRKWCTHSEIGNIKRLLSYLSICR